MHHAQRVRKAAALLVLMLLAGPTLGAIAPKAARRAPVPAPTKPGATTTAAKTKLADPEQPLYYLSWHAPHGLPRASEVCAPSCGDSTRIDTLWISFSPSRDESTFVGILGVLTLTTGTGDSLPGFWQMGRGGANHGGMYAEFGSSEDMPGEHAFEANGVGSVEFERTIAGAYFRFFYVVSEGRGIPLRAGHRYTAGRILVRAMRPGLVGCTTPVCLSWGRADFGFETGRTISIKTGGAHVVSRGIGPNPCRARMPAWQPKPSASRTPTPAPGTAAGEGGH